MSPTSTFKPGYSPFQNNMYFFCLSSRPWPLNKKWSSQGNNKSYHPDSRSRIVYWLHTVMLCLIRLLAYSTIEIQILYDCLKTHNWSRPRSTSHLKWSELYACVKISTSQCLIIINPFPCYKLLFYTFGHCNINGKFLADSTVFFHCTLRRVPGPAVEKYHHRLKPQIHFMLGIVHFWWCADIQSDHFKTIECSSSWHHGQILQMSCSVSLCLCIP